MLVLLLSLFSCEEPVVKVSSIVLNSETLEMTEGETFKLTATVSPDNATDKTVIWSSSNASIASIEAGLVTAVKEGTATITVESKDGGARTACAVTVSPKVIPVESITLSQNEAVMQKGETVSLTATVKPANATEAVVWTSNNTSVATVKDGVVTAVGIGAASITATAGDKNASCTVTVKEAYIEVTSITLNQTSFFLMEGDSYLLTATVKPSDATDKTVTWSSSDEKLATVYGGKVTAIKAGNVTITAKAGDKTATCEIEITPRIAVESVTLNHTELTLLLGATETLSAEVLPENATDKSVKWSSSDTDVVVVRNNGKITAVGLGTAVITAKAGEKSATCKVTVKPVEVESIALNKTYLTLNLDESETLTVIFTPENVTDKTVTWESSDPNIVTVKDGTVHAIARGTVTITARCGKATATCEVKVNENYLTITNLTNYTGVVTIKASGVTVPTITLQYSTDKGATWASLDAVRTTQTIPLPANGSVMLAGANQTFCSTTNTKGWWSISSDVSHTVSGDLMTISGDTDELLSKYEFYKLFSGNNKLKSAKYLHLSAEKLSDYCYSYMFEKCTELEEGPQIEATTLATNCCKSMFESCKALTVAPKLPAKEVKTYSYSSMFKDCLALTTAPDLPATKLGNNCYENMFYGCKALVNAPSLPATGLAVSCYSSMFESCTALEKAPAMPAQILSVSCYNSMFKNCTALKEAPELPATKLTKACYMAMFNGCTSLEKAPNLPATTLAEKCYYQMFVNCFKLTEAPLLPAKRLVIDCYNSMFSLCGNLKAVTCLATDISATSCILNWLNNVSPTGTFAKDPEMKDWVVGTIPAGWTIVDYVEETEE